jgi:divalent metal cation (Fe/Co/Zn/Cd) transporter
MRLPRALAGALLWILASVVGLLGALLCVTIIGLPIGIFLLRRAGRMFSAAVKLMLPSSLAHPLQEAKQSVRDKGKDGAERTKDKAVQVKKKVKKKRKKSWERRLGL